LEMVAGDQRGGKVRGGVVFGGKKKRWRVRSLWGEGRIRTFYWNEPDV